MNSDLLKMINKILGLKHYLLGGDDGAIIGNSGDRLKVDAEITNSPDVDDGGGVHGTLTVGTTAVELMVSGSPLANRACATLNNSSNSIIYWGYVDTVTVSTGTPLLKDQERGWRIGPDTHIWLIAASPGNVCRITERAK